jgi:hypothetical protein
VHNRRIRDS